MKRGIIFVIALSACIALAASAKPTEKPFPKKVANAKKKSAIKSSQKSALDAFKELPAEDLAFLKELDKQFKLHGDNVKIKVERDNRTTTGTKSGSKTSKRTIEGELGYGYLPPSSGYHFSAPRYMLYPYSQRDIPPSAPGYELPTPHRYLPPSPSRRPSYERTTVSIQPSYAYEIRQHPHGGYETQSPYLAGHNQLAYSHPAQQQQYAEPVIVLRIPGPAKYASHLQALLQQYLEIRAAQYVRLLQEHESHQQHHQAAPVAHHGPVHPQHYHAQAHPQQYQEVQIGHQAQQQYHQQVQVNHQPQSVQYQEIHLGHTGPHGHAHQESYSQAQPGIQEVYQHYRGKQHQHQHNPQPQAHQVHQQQYQAPVEYETAPQSAPAGHGAQGAEPQYIYVQETPNAQQEIHIPHGGGNGQQNGEYEQVIYIQEVDQQPQQVPQPQQHAPQPQLPVYGAPHQSQHQTYAVETQSHDEHFPISENSPRDTHTKVVFTMADASHGESPNHALPSIKPFERHEPKSTPLYHQDYEHSQLDQQHQSIGSDYQPSQPREEPHHQQTDESDISLSEVNQRPYNYHAHSLNLRSRTSSKRDALSPEIQYKKLNTLIEKLRTKELKEKAAN